MKMLVPERMMQALQALDARLDTPVHLVVGGGGAMLLAYDCKQATQDVDAFAGRGSPSVEAISPHTRAVAKELDIEPDWLNPHFETFTGVLPSDYASRLRKIFSGARLVVDALGPEDLLIMKCFAGRDKDRPHARALMKRKDIDLGVVDRQLSLLGDKRYPGSDRAADFFDDLRDELGL
ncbi:MAG: hypothetical protein IT378_03375 [Sandaracinaceae bacterium]|nr:hypothetical protein [Sandaracinaceae bacterium]